jgi:muramidase (phage lysozyme)
LTTPSNVNSTEQPENPDEAVGTCYAGNCVPASLSTASNSAEIPYTKEEVIQLIHHWSEYFNVPVEHPLRIARCESNYRWDAKNKTSSASGVFQYLSGTWSKTFEGKAGLSVFDADANIRAAIRHMSVHGYDAWECK